MMDLDEINVDRIHSDQYEGGTLLIGVSHPIAPLAPVALRKPQSLRLVRSAYIEKNA